MKKKKYIFGNVTDNVTDSKKYAVIDLSEGNEKKLTYEELKSEALVRSRVFRRKYNLKNGDCCIVMCENSPVDMLISIMAISICGATGVPLKTVKDISLDERSAYIIKDCKARLIISDREIRNVQDMEVYRVDVEKSEKTREGQKTDSAETDYEGSDSDYESESREAAPNLIMYTSGSTGYSKGVPETGDALYTLLMEYNKQLHRDSQSVTYCNLPLYHVFGLITLAMGSLYAGGTLVIRRTSDFVADNLSWFKDIYTYKANYAGAPNYMVSMLCDAAEELEKADISSLKGFLLGTEMIRPSNVKHFIDKTKRFCFDPGAITITYGLSETGSVFTTTPYMEAPVEKKICGIDGNIYDEVYSAGVPIEDAEIIVVDENRNNILANRECGEICVRGSILLEDYIGGGIEEDTILIDGKKYFCTGDLGFIDGSETNELYITGRKKEILIIRGENYSPYYIEKMIEEKIEGVVKAAAISVPYKESEGLVIIGAISENEEAFDAVENSKKDIIAGRIQEKILSGFSLGVHSVILCSAEDFNYTTSGKLKRSEMKERVLKGDIPGKIYKNSLKSLNEDNPEDDIKAFIKKQIKEEVTIDSDTSFMSLGMDSLSLQVLIQQLNEKYGCNIRMANLGRYPTVGSLGNWVNSIAKDNTAGDSSTDYKFKNTYDDKKRFTLTDIQKAYLAGRNPELDWGGVSCQYYFEQDFQEFDIERFKASVRTLMERHESLRMVVDEKGEQRLLDMDSVSEIPVSFINIKEEEQLKLRTEICNQTLPMDKPLFKIVVAEMETKFRVMFLIDMLVCDAASILIFYTQLLALYNGEELGEAPSYTEWLMSKKHLHREEDREYWRNKEIYLAPQLIYDIKAPKVSRGKFSRKSVYISKETYEKFKNMVAGLGITSNVAFLTLFAELLSTYGAGDKFTISVTSTERVFSDDKKINVMGDLTGVILSSIKLSNLTMKENAEFIQQGLREDLSHMDFSHFDILREFEDVRESSDSFPVVFTSFLGLDTVTESRTPFDRAQFSQSITPQVVLDHQLLPTEDGGILVCWDLIKEAFEEGIADKMFETYKELLERAMEEDFWKEELLDLRSKSEKKIQAASNSTDEDIPECDMVSGFHKKVKEMPENTAVIHKGEAYTYKQLADRADEISLYLSGQGIGVGDRVMIQMDKSFDLIAAIIGTIQTGAIYLPMPHDQPENRQLDIYEGAGASIMISDGICNISSKIPGFIVGEDFTMPGVFEKPKIDPESLGYIIYTSGSTGKPKGVAIEHRAAMNTIQAVNKYVNLTEEDCLIGVSSVSFDLSVYDIFGALNVGASLVVPTEAERIDPSCWYELCCENKVTVWNSVPALMSLFLDYCLMSNKDRSKLKIKDIILSGDWIPMDLFGKKKEVMPQARLTSMGGATEASIWSNYYTVNEQKSDWVSIPYGYPLPNQRFYILDALNRPCPNGVSGRLHIAGKGLAQGYYNAKELTENAFYDHPYLEQRVYDTGDYGRYDDNGCIIFMGRKDSQIKINGYRIELGEIQSAFTKAGYPENAVIVVEENGRGKRLYGFVKTEKIVQERELSAKLEEFLPGYFIPERIFGLKEFPHTANGKLDKKALIKYGNSEGKDSQNKMERIYTETDKKVLKLLEEGWGIQNLQPDSRLSGLGITSLELICMANMLETELGYRAKVNEIIRYNKVMDFLEFYRNTSAKDQDDQIKKTRDAEKRREEEIKRSDALYDHKVMEVLREELQTVDIRSDMELVSLGLSSLSVIRIANRLETIYNCRPSIHDMLRYKTIKDMIDYYETADTNKTDLEDNISEKLQGKHPVLRCIGELLNKADISETDSFAGLGVSSLEVIRIANQLESMYKKRPSMEELAAVTSFKDLMEYYKDYEEVQYEVSPEDEERTRIIKLYNKCKDLDIILWPENGNLKFKAPQGAITQELKEELKEHKEGLMRYLSDRDTVTSQDLTPLQLAYVLGRQNDHVLGDITAHYYVEYEAKTLDLEKLGDAVNELIVRNEILRTIITPEGRVKVLNTNPGYTVECVSYKERNLREEMKDYKFPLGQWPMFDVKVTEEQDRFVIHIGLDCLILDGWSITMFMKQLVSAYKGEDYKVTDYTFRQYLEEEREWLRNKTYYHEARDYWEKHIDELPPAPRLPLKNSLESIKKPEFGRKRFALSDKQTFSLFMKIRQLDLTPSMVLCTAYMMSLSKYSSTKDVMLNLTMFNRQPIHPEVQEVLGDFTNIALIGFKPKEKQNFMEAIAPVKKELWNNIEYRSFNVINLLGRLAEKHNDVVAAPYVFTSLIDSEGEGSEALMSEIGFKEIFAQTQTPQVVLDHQLYLKNGKLVLVFDYVKQAFDDEMLEQLIKDYTDRVTLLSDSDDWEEIYE